MAETRTRVVPQNSKSQNCPACGHKQAEGKTECDSCGLIFSKHLGFTPIKTITSTFLSPKEVKEIRKTQERLSRIQHDNTSKMELLVHCHKEKLLDMAAHHIGKDETIKNMALSNLESEKSYRTGSLLAFFSKPLAMISIMLLLTLIAIALFLRSYG